MQATWSEKNIQNTSISNGITLSNSLFEWGRWILCPYVDNIGPKKTQRDKVSMMEYYAYKLQVRPDEGTFTYIKCILTKPVTFIWSFSNLSK